ncbi:zinc metalloproteinase-disintegrin-like crotastatin [Xenopus laevis]|uniref:Zinc metalloproteinase-disintegrin-like crotastatin n=1 Tax=Xenopus laevis TaxID=8355 RepID=A0A8J0UP88_XENLA|nr:zinc metalloproteinase-disintegrin-like crotastatin [Xenopus laevis]
MLLPLLLLTAGLLLPHQPAASFKLTFEPYYEVVFPKKIHTQYKRDVQGKYPDMLQYGLHIGGKHLVLHLEKNEDLLSANYTETYYLPDGTPVTTSPKIQHHCYYQGNVKNDNSSLLSLSTCSGLSGLIQTEGQMYLIEPLKETDSEAHAVYEAQMEIPKTCGVDNTTYREEIVVKKSRSGTSAEQQQILKAQKYVHLYVVADNSMFVKYNRSIPIVNTRIYEIINFVNVVYKAINTFVALTGIEVWNVSDQFKVVTSASQNLGAFSDWRKNVLLRRNPNDNAQFLTNTDFDGATVGLAFVATMCSDSHSAGVIQDHSKPSIAVGATVAHEMGHNLGMNHDTSSCSCDANSCIMAPALSYNTPRLFSSCSLQNYQDFLFSQMPQCILIVPLKEDIITPAVCGNKFTEIGEDCDCGTVEECTNPCCDAATCKLVPTAKCAEGECCDNCQIKKPGDVCRAAKDDCDLADLCDGMSPVCPSDRFRVNGFPCKNGQGYCFNGRCPTHQSQCTTLWGASSVVSEDSCFNANTKGVSYGYCTMAGATYVPCKPKDIKCGMLFCYGGSTQPSVYASVAEFSRCRAVLAPAGMVQNGTKCGDGMVCYSGSCTSIESAYRSTNCSEKCSGHAVCDHELQCQCEEGWAPPTCEVTSPTNIVIIIVVIIIALALVIGLVLLVIFCRRKGKKQSTSSFPETVDGSTNPSFRNRPPAQMQHFPQVPKPEPATDKTWPSSRVGYQAPQYSVTTASPQPEPKLKKPTVAPPPIPSAKPAPPSAPPKALKPPVRS